MKQQAVREPRKPPKRISVSAHEHCCKKGGSGASLVLATRASKRSRGLLFTKPHKRTLLLMPCKDVHTVGMRHPLDIAFVDQGGSVIEVHHAVGPLRRLHNGKAAAVVERFSSCETPWFSVGDRLKVFGEKEV